MPDLVDDAKRALRADLRERRAMMAASARETATNGFTAQLEALVSSLGARSVSCYVSTSSEPDTRAFIRAAVARGIRVLLPVTRVDGLLDWAIATPEGDFEEGLFGVPEPTGELLGPIAVNDVDLMIIPAAAVDRTGMRLGWGRGYFDKTIGSMENCPPVYAVVFDTELLDLVPSEPHDQPVTGVVTPTQTIPLASATR